jgi:hypothetical protein
LNIAEYPERTPESAEFEFLLILKPVNQAIYTMGSHPFNLAIRFILEVVVLLSMGYWGWKYGNGWMRYVLAIGIPVILAVIWATFNVPGDPSRSGEAPVVTPGSIRLVLELAFFAGAAWALRDLGYIKLSLAFSVVVILHYLASWDRIAWLLSQ